MSLLPTPPVASPVAPARLRSATATLARAAAAIWQGWTNRGAVRRLAELDDRMLTDIGLSRNDLHGALAVPFSRDPSVYLRVRAVDRRARARAASLAAARVRRGAEKDQPVRPGAQARSMID